MIFFRPGKRKIQAAQKEAEIKAIRKDTYKQIEKANKSMDKVTKFLEDDGGITYRIFLATGGDKRGNKK